MKSKKEKDIVSYAILGLVAVMLVVVFWPQKEKVEPLVDDVAEKQKEFESAYRPFATDMCSFFSITKVLYGFDEEFKIVEVKKGMRISIGLNEKIYTGVTPETGWFFQNSKGIFGTSGKIIGSENLETKHHFQVKQFPLVWSVSEITPLIKKFPLTCRDDDRLPIETYEGFLQLKESYSNFKEVLFDKETSPELILLDQKGEIILMNKDGKCWLTREQSHNKHGWKYDPNSTAFYGR